MTRISMILLAFLVIAPMVAADPVDAGDFTTPSQRRTRLGEAEQDSLQELIDWLFGRSNSRWGFGSGPDVSDAGPTTGTILPRVLPWLGKGFPTHQPVRVRRPGPSITLVNPPIETPGILLPPGYDPPFPPRNPPIPGPVPTITPPLDPPPGTPESIPNPEPGTLLLIGMGAAGVAYRRRRRARS